jgi:hypothetical protein
LGGNGVSVSNPLDTLDAFCMTVTVGWVAVCEWV